MAAVSLAPHDLTPFADIPPAKAEAMIEDALALAARVSPCILEDEFEFDNAARAILRGAILRWHEAGTGARQQHAVGQVSETYDTRQERRGMFWPSEITQLERLCASSQQGGAYAIDTAPDLGLLGHADVCSLNFGATYCSCGAVLTADLYPLYEVEW